ncbi:LuxR C-terminal-related transcriptional regulator [Pedobacter sp.]|jgi:DNA-binding CsgD family transcriptional regulator|uniref:LuxR C-terminal-related transcriptional regulator n=1 Tax=Pedobacter sp. TaxID=1411316 RepID=UPI002BC7E379|nr:LuxR C-terminal-related transcriptional regulator [Pedobacter sp.]HWW39435.1 LuxR C-terminal-related transcriptional regulator [Pedobacter sp.]
MNSKKNFGEYSKNFISDVPADQESDEAQYFNQTIPRFPEEAIYIYSFKLNKMVYASGWEEVVGYKDDEINMLAIVNMSAPEFAPFSHDLNDKALKFIHNKTKDLEKYSFTIELKKIHKNGTLVPIVARVGVYSSENGKVTAIIGRFQINRNLIFGKVMRYAAFGPEKEKFEEELNKILFSHLAISDKEKEALALVAKGYSFKEIAHELNVSHSAIEKRIIPLYKRFNVKSLTHLVSFSYDNSILP